MRPNRSGIKTKRSEKAQKFWTLRPATSAELTSRPSLSYSDPARPHHPIAAALLCSHRFNFLVVECSP